MSPSLVMVSVLFRLLAERVQQPSQRAGVLLQVSVCAQRVGTRGRDETISHL